MTSRDATPGDNEALVELSVACPMEGDIGLAVDRAPDFFVLNRLEGESWRVGVVDGADARPVGCIAVAARDVYLNGEPVPAMYISDLKVHPAHRGQGVADALIIWARDACIATHGPDVLAFMTVLAGNRSMQRLMEGPRGLPVMKRVATFRTHSIPILRRRRLPGDGAVTVAAAHVGDLPEMAALWARLAPGRQFAAVHDESSMGAWIHAASNLEISDYLVARRPDTRIAGFLGVWDQSDFKRLRVTGYSPKLGAVRFAFNALAPVMRATKLPPAGGALRNLTAVQVCAPPDDPVVLRALVRHAHNAASGRGFSFLNVGLDVEDPLAAGLEGLLAQSTDIWVCVGTLGGPPPPLDGRPSHHEVALV